LVVFLVGALLVAKVEGLRTGNRSASLASGLYAWLLLAVPIGLLTVPAVTILLLLAALVLLSSVGVLKLARFSVRRALGRILNATH
jgi:hypothetical protein